MNSSSNINGRRAGRLATIMMTAHSTIFQTRMLSIEFGLVRKKTKRIVWRATTNNPKTKIPASAILCELLRWRWDSIDSGRNSADCKLVSQGSIPRRSVMIESTKNEVLPAFALSRSSKQPNDGTLSVAKNCQFNSGGIVLKVMGFQAAGTKFMPLGTSRFP
jgi:hypothetical protein